MSEFLDHIKEGLGKTPKRLSSRYFYDERGDALFQQIMQLGEYYLPALERAIIGEQGEQIAKKIAGEHNGLQVVELGAGDGSKTKLLLQKFASHFDSLVYTALDISEHILKVNAQNVEQFVPGIRVEGHPGNYFKTYPRLPYRPQGRLVLFLGSNIGNFLIDEAVEFFGFLKKGLRAEDFLLVSFDLVKHPRKIIKAYDDPQGITRAFNLNLLERMNREAGANFDVAHFDHFPYYDPLSGVTSSHIVSLREQEVSFKDGFSVQFDAFEAIHTEVSKKYFLKEIDSLAALSGIHIAERFCDPENEYALVLYKPMTTP